MSEPVYRPEIDRLAEDTLSLWKAQYEFWQRMTVQQAPLSLQNEMAQISELYKQLHERLVQIAPYFPPEL